MLNFLLSILTLNISVVSIFYGIRINRLKQVFQGITTVLITPSISYDEDNNPYFKKDILVSDIKRYFENNISDKEYDLIFYFQEIQHQQYISDYPTTVQIELRAKIFMNYQYIKNVRFYISGREVSKDWYAII